MICLALASFCLSDPWKKFSTPIKQKTSESSSGLIYSERISQFNSEYSDWLSCKRIMSVLYILDPSLWQQLFLQPKDMGPTGSQKEVGWNVWPVWQGSGFNSRWMRCVEKHSFFILSRVCPLPQFPPAGLWEKLIKFPVCFKISQSDNLNNAFRLSSVSPMIKHIQSQRISVSSLLISYIELVWAERWVLLKLVKP